MNSVFCVRKKLEKYESVKDKTHTKSRIAQLEIVEITYILALPAIHESMYPSQGLMQRVGRIPGKCIKPLWHMNRRAFQFAFQH